jgi:hypothetical protein
VRSQARPANSASPRSVGLNDLDKSDGAKKPRSTKTDTLVIVNSLEGKTPELGVSTTR